MEAHLLLKKYEDYFEGFPESIVLRCTICKGNCIVGDSQLYFGAELNSMKHGDYGIYLTVVPEDVLVVYEGSWFQDVYNGKGYLYILASPKLQKRTFRCYAGEWKNGKMNGKGCIKEYQDRMWKVIYEGTFLNDHLHGVGTSNNLGVIYRGEFRHGSKTGYGRLSNMLGQYYEGYFEKGFPVSEGFEKKGDVYVYKDQNENKRVFRKRKGQTDTDFYSFILQSI